MKKIFSLLMIVQLAGLLFAVNADELTLCEGDYYSRDEEQTQAPEIIGEDIHYDSSSWRITITDEYEEEPCTIYYRVAELDEDNWSEWMEYETSLVFTERGHYYIEAYAIADGKLPSQLSSFEFWVYTWEPVPETCPPEIIGEQIYYNDYNYWYWRITITDEYEEEPCTIYYRVAELDEDNWSEWMEYETSLVFTERGHYYIEACAIADGKLLSQLSSYEFIVFAPDYPPTMRGDVDGDGEVAIADVSALIDYLLTGNASAINLDAADVDTDGEVSIADVSALIDYLLTGAW